MKTFSIFIASILLHGTSLRSAERKPNVLFIAVDDMRCDLGCYGVKEVISPNLDRLASSGVLFKRAYCQVAVCNPSRVSLMTGLRPDTSKVWDLPTEFRTTVPEAVTIPQHFRKHGYRALGFGKIFHNPFPDDVSWDEPHAWPKNAKTWSEDAMAQLKEVKEEMRAAGEPEAKIERLRSLGTERVDIKDSEHADGAMTDQALAAMRDFASKDQPFFLAAGFIRPHLPFVVPRKYWDLYDPAKIKLAPNGYLPSGASAVAFGDRSMGGLYELRDYMNYRHVPSPLEGSLAEADQRELKHGYYASVSFVDAQVGRLLDELDRLGLAENTIVVLWSDHGWKLGEHNGWCKQTNYEIDTRAPLMIRAPGAKANGKPSNALVEFVDVYPTLCELASLPVPKVLEGMSLVPLLHDFAATVKDAAFSQFERTHEAREYMGCAIRTETHRYIEWRDRKSGKVEERELYDHQSDPQENQNIATDPAQEALITGLSARIAKQFKPANWKKEPPQLTIVNNGRQPVEIFWLPEKGERKKSGTLAPGKQQTINTVMGHRFLIQGAKTDFQEAITVTKAKQQFILNAAPPKSAAKLQIINGSSQPIDIFWLKSDTERLPNGSLPPGKDSIITTSLGHRFVVVGRNDKTEATVTSEVPVQGFRFDPPSKTGVPSFYTQSASADGFPIVASPKVNPYALKEASFLIKQMLANRPDVREALVKSGARMCIMGREEYTTDLPEFAHLGTEPQPQFPGIDAKDYWDRRARGTGGSQTDPFCSSAEENILGFPGDPYVKECILIHEFAHCIHLRGMVNVDPTFDTRLKATYESAMKAGLWAGKYASVNRFEYFAEGVQSWFDDNRVNDHDHNHVHLRSQLLEYDPGLAAMCREVFGDTVLKYTKPATRLTDHMAGYDPSTAPTFTWPERLTQADVAIKASAKERNDKANPRETRQISGWTVHINKELFAKDAKLTERVLEILQGQLDEVIRVVPAAAVAELKKVPLWINPEYPNTRPSAEYHPDAEWLIKNKRAPEMAKGVEITNVRMFEAETRRMPNVTLHELAHAYHDRVVRMGFANLEIKAAYKQAKSSGKYDRVERHLGNGKPNTFELAYAMTTAQEYFAETSEALFVGNDFFPFTRAELKQHDPAMLALLLRLWGVPTNPP